jgi:thiamine-monophosphate kinase
MSEFDIIRSRFTGVGAARSDVILGVGDDCALLAVPSGMELAVSIDTLSAGVHFLPDCDPEGLGHKSLAVGLSDLAAMGAEPAWATLALALPPDLAEGAWLGGFARGFAELAAGHGVALVGGDTTQGPLCISVQVHGFVPAGEAVRRSGARPGDLVCVSGTLGDAGLALRQILGAGSPDDSLRQRLERPTPRVSLGLALRGLATAMIDCSDGLAADLGHILESSGVGADLDLGALPLSPQVEEAIHDLSEDGRDKPPDWALALASGDDYELCFCLPPGQAGQLAALERRFRVRLTPIGRIRAGGGLVCRGLDGEPVSLDRPGYDHFPGRT